MAFVLFQSPIGFHMYDREKNKVITLHQEEYDALLRVNSSSVNDEDALTLKLFQDKGYCTQSTLEDIEHPETNKLGNFLNQKVGGIVLQVTQNCNLRCAYCTYSGNYYNRKHNSQRMSLDTAIRSVDFLMDHSASIGEVSIGFYGGEPLLEFSLIQQVVNYVKSEYPDREVRFNMTSNVTLLTEKVMDFLACNKIDLMISIDGPKDIQDRYRIFRDGTGSFEKVLANVTMLREKYPAYYRKCRTNTVISSGEDYKAIHTFLDKDDIFGPLYSMESLIASSAAKVVTEYDDEFYILAKREKFKMMLSLLGEISEEKVSSFSNVDRDQIYTKYQMLKHNGLQNQKKAHPAGPCIPGARRIFVDVHGSFYPCEKIPENENFRIGNVAEGFDTEKIEHLINLGSYTKKECLNCWAFFHCTTCAISMIDKTHLSREKRLSHCSDVMSATIDQFMDIEVLKHYGYAFDGGYMEGESVK